MKLPCFVLLHKGFSTNRGFGNENKIFEVIFWWNFHFSLPNLCLSHYHIWHKNIVQDTSAPFIHAYLNAIWCQCKSNKFNLMANISDASLFSWTTFMPPSTSIKASLEYFDPPELLVVSERNEIKCWFIISLKWWCLLTYTCIREHMWMCVGIRKRKKTFIIEQLRCKHKSEVLPEI